MISTSSTVTPAIPISSFCLIPSPKTDLLIDCVLSSSQAVPFILRIALCSKYTLMLFALSVSSSKFFSYFSPSKSSKLKFPGVELLSIIPAGVLLFLIVCLFGSFSPSA